MKTIALQRKTRFRGLDRVGWMFTFAAAAYNLYECETCWPSLPERPAGTLPMAITAAAGTPDQPTLDAATRITESKPLTQNLQGALFSSLLEPLSGKRCGLG